MSKTEVFVEGQRAVVEKYLNEAKSRITIAMAYFTDELIFNLLVDKAKQGVKVKLIVRDDEFNIKKGINYQVLNELNGEFSYDKGLGHSFCVIDGIMTLTGTYNWCTSSSFNHGDIVLIRDDFNSIAHLYESLFSKIKDPVLFALKAKATHERMLKGREQRKTAAERREESGHTRILYNDKIDSIATTVKSIIQPLQEFGFTGTVDKVEAMSIFSIVLGQRAQAAMIGGATKGNYLLDTGVNVYYAMYEECFVVDTDRYKLDLPLFVLTAMYLESTVKRVSLKLADDALKRELFDCIYKVCKEGFSTQVQFTNSEAIEVMNKFCLFLQRKYSD